MTLQYSNFARSRGQAMTAQAEPTEMSETEAARALFLERLVPVKKHLYNFVQKSLNFSHDTDDLFQDALLKGFRYFHSYDRDKSFKTWIFTIAHNIIKDHFKSKSMLLMEDADRVAGPETTAMPEEVRDIYTAAAKLKPRNREVFFLYYYNEFKVAEIVTITGLTKVNVKFILHQARKTIKKMMEVQS